MSVILSIESSGLRPGVALSRDGELVVEREATDGERRPGDMLAPLVDEAMAVAEGHGWAIDAVAVSGGPGSYTGLRIGTSMAKALAYGLGVPLVAVSTLELMCVPLLLGGGEEPLRGCYAQDEAEALLLPMLDARRMEVYAAVYDRSLRALRAVGADVVDGDTYKEWLQRGPLLVFGPGAEKCLPLMAHPNLRYVAGQEPRARWMFPLAEKRLLRGEVEDVAYYEPRYLKEFRAR